MEDPRHRSIDDQGQVLPLVALVLVAAAGAALLLARVAITSVAIGAAGTAADAAALAAAAGSDGDAAAVASRNGAVLLAVERLPNGDVRAHVDRSGVRQSARARPGVSRNGGLAPAMQAALARAEQLLGRPVPITSGHRSWDAQQRLWDARAGNPFPVARPGTSMHERGLAIDVPLAFADTLAAVAGAAGLCRPLPDDPVHFEVCRPRFVPRGGG